MLTSQDAAPLADEEVDARLARFETSSLLVAVSGGPDSLALAAAVARWRERRPGPPATAACVDHGLRPSSRAEAESVLAACASFGLPCRLLSWEGEKPKTRVQERARQARRRLLAEAARAAGASVILLGHHADDQAETVLLRLLRGSGPAGLAGMAALSPCPGAPDLRLGRPFLDVSKARLRATATALGLSAIEDPSNLDPRFARTRMRLLLRALAAEGGVPERFARLAARARRAEEALEELADATAERLSASRAATTSRGGMSFGGAEWSALPRELRLRLLARGLRAAAPAARALGEEKNLASDGSRPDDDACDGLDAYGRLERLEALEERLVAAVRSGAPRAAATLGDVKIVFDGARLRFEPAPPRRASASASRAPRGPTAGPSARPARPGVCAT